MGGSQLFFKNSPSVNDSLDGGNEEADRPISKVTKVKA